MLLSKLFMLLYYYYFSFHFITFITYLAGSEKSAGSMASGGSSSIGGNSTATLGNEFPSLTFSDDFPADLLQDIDITSIHGNFFNFKLCYLNSYFFQFKNVLFLFYCLNLNSLCGYFIAFFLLMLMYIEVNRFCFVLYIIPFIGIINEI